MSATGKLIAGVLALVLVGSVAGCSSSAPAGEGIDVTIGSHGTLEGEILAQVYGQVLASEGYTVDYNYGIGGYARGVSGLRTGTIDLMPDYTGALLASINSHATSNSSVSIMTELPKSLAPLGLAVLDPTQIDTSNAFVTTRDFQEAHSLENIGDISLFATAVTMGGPTGFEASSYGRTALTNRYGVSDWIAKPEKSEEQIVEDLRFNRTQIAVLPLTSPGIVANDFVILEDPEHVMVSNQIIPVIAARKFTPAFADIVDSVSHQLTTVDLSLLIAEANKATNQPDEALTVQTIVANWLSEKKIVGADSSD